MIKWFEMELDLIGNALLEYRRELRQKDIEPERLLDVHDKMDKLKSRRRTVITMMKEYHNDQYD